MLTKIAWKNIWRNRNRSAVLITAITLGIWALILINGLSIGMVDSYIDTAIRDRTSHLQIHTPDFVDEPEITGFFDGGPVTAFLDRSDLVQAYSPRVIVQGMISSAQSSRGVLLYGIDHEKENKLTALDEKIEDGTALLSDGGNYILLSDDMADRLGVKVRSRVVLNFQTLRGEVTAAAFRVAGIIDGGTKLSGVDRAYAPIQALRELTGMEADQIQELALLVHQLDQIPIEQKALESSFPHLSVRNYKEIAPDVALMGSQTQISLTIMIAIFMLALIFGIINTMLMAILERYKELGMLLAVGMKKARFLP